MSRLNYLRAVAVLILVGVTVQPTRGAAQRRPNVVLLMSDDHAAHAISAYQKYLKNGAHLPRTPNLDRLGRDGMLFVN